MPFSLLLPSIQISRRSQFPVQFYEMPSNGTSAERALAVGIDVGNCKCVVAFCRDGVVDAVLNEESKRETPSVIYFASDHRLFGSVAANYAASQPSSTFSQLKRLVSSGHLGKEGGVLPDEITEKPGLGITVNVHKEEFTAAAMLGMLLGHLKRSTESTLGSTISACVIGIPSYFSPLQKKALGDAAVIAGLDLLKLLPDGEAIATEYGHYRTAAAAVNVVFVDIGHCDTQITVARFEGGEITFLGNASDPDLGGRDFDEVIFNHFFQMFKAQYGKEDFSLNAKAKLKLRMASEKAKKVLSVNRDAQVNIDYLTSDFDANGVITREEFEGLSSGLRERIVDKCREALDNAMLDGESVDSVELVGSGSRVPAISKDLAAFFDREMSRTLNGTECVARGCALVCEQLLHQDNGTPGFFFWWFWRFIGFFWEWFTRRFAPLRMGRVEEEEDGRWPKRKLEGDLLSAYEREQRLLEKDRAVELAKEARNELESLIYRIRAMVKKKMTKSASDEEIYRKIGEMEDWIYQEGDNASAEEYKAKKRELTSILKGTEYAMPSEEPQPDK